MSNSGEFPAPLKLQKPEGHSRNQWLSTKPVGPKPTPVVVSAEENWAWKHPKIAPERPRQPEQPQQLAPRRRPRAPYARNAANAARALQNKREPKTVLVGPGNYRSSSLVNKFGREFSLYGNRQIGGPESILPPKGTYGASSREGRYYNGSNYNHHPSRKNRKNRKTRRRKNRTRRNRR